MLRAHREAALEKGEEKKVCFETSQEAKNSDYWRVNYYLHKINIECNRSSDF